jgi:ABC-2 type transport system ATP-binding protein
MLGPNGAGKTTTIEIIEGLLDATSGGVEVLGYQWGRHDDEIRQRLGISLQETRLSEKLSVLETLTLFRSFYRRGMEPGEAMARVGLEEKEAAWIKSLSGGQKQRLAVACALVGDPELLCLDEPTTGLDPQSRRQIWEIIRRFRETGRTVLLTTHYMDEAERLCDRVAIVDAGRLIALGTPSELIATLGGDHVIEFALENGVLGERLEPSEFGVLPGVSESRIDDGKIRLSVREPHVAIPALLSRLAAANLELTSLATRHASLEDVFVKLAGRHITEEDVPAP